MERSGGTSRHNILRAALNLFRQRGYSHVTVEDIVKEVGLTKGAFYYNFSSKHDLLRDLNEEFTQHSLKRFQEIITADKSPKEKLEEAVEHLMFESTHMGAYFQVFFDERRHLEEHLFEVFKNRRGQVRNAIAQVLRDGMEIGQFRSDLKPELVAFALRGMCSWVYHWYSPNGPDSVETVTRTFTQLLLEGLTPRATTGQPMGDGAEAAYSAPMADLVESLSGFQMVESFGSKRPAKRRKVTALPRQREDSE